MENWDNLRERCINCTACPLCETRTNVVFGSGSTNAEILFIGEGPGEQEDLKGEAFVGRAGKLLDDMLAIIGLNRSNIYITNIVKCRPPKNRDPLNTEQEACIKWLRKQTALLKPKIIVCLGRIAAARIIGPDFKITRDHGKWYKANEFSIMALYHPSALLRDPSKRPETFLDLKELKRKIKEICTHTYN